MERLTKKEMIAGHEMKYVSADDCFDVWSVPQKFMGEAIDRLAAYEDIGFTPEEMKDIIDMFHSYRHICAGLEPERVTELTQAEKEGRLVLLPCSLDATVYMLDSRDGLCAFHFEEVSITDMGDIIYKTPWCGTFTPNNFGKFVFLTRKEAEEALEKIRSEDNEID